MTASGMEATQGINLSLRSGSFPKLGAITSSGGINAVKFFLQSGVHAVRSITSHPTRTPTILSCI